MLLGFPLKFTFLLNFKVYSNLEQPGFRETFNFLACLCLMKLIVETFELRSFNFSFAFKYKSSKSLECFYGFLQQIVQRQSYEIKLPSQAFLDGKSSPWLGVMI